MEAIILAGGFGTRLRAVVSDIPKPMALVGGKPFLEHVLKYAENNGVSKAILSVGYKHKSIMEHFGESFCNISLAYSAEDSPLDTGGAIKIALEKVDSETVIILNGDTFFDVNLSELMKFSTKLNADVSIALKTMSDFDRYGAVETDKHQITAFREKAYSEQGYINGGVYCVKRELFRKFDLPDRFSFETFLSDNLKKLNICGFECTGNFIDIGIPDDYEKSQCLIPQWVAL
jgi:D-glycero-alpha-D-manno-heptose 1-phosphate guanylyltransferase